MIMTRTSYRVDILFSKRPIIELFLYKTSIKIRICAMLGLMYPIMNIYFLLLLFLFQNFEIIMKILRRSLCYWKKETEFAYDTVFAYRQYTN